MTITCRRKVEKNVDRYNKGNDGAENGEMSKDWVELLGFTSGSWKYKFLELESLLCIKY